jgi:hypothetical protein
MIPCPYCRKPAMTLWEKLTTRPRRPMSCRSCGKQISISQSAIFAILAPITVGAFIAGASRSLTLGALAIIMGAVAGVAIYLYAVPVVGRDA